ncbi:hypothetical protein TNCV_4800961 [Trichonephila clavipes]|nr:hypothetical protein TNCV_4800961 [Trichonephila clavipes]
MNQASALEGQTLQRSLDSNLGDTVSSPLVHLGGQLLNGSTSICPNASPQPSFTAVILPMVHHIYLVADFGQSLFSMHVMLLPWRHANSSQTYSHFLNVSTFVPRANDHALLDIG